MLVYRVQPIGMDLGDHRSETSEGNQDQGVHVFTCLRSLQHGVNGWCRADYTPEVVVIECRETDLRDNGDFEGFVLVGNRGRIVARRPFASWTEFASYCRSYEATLL